jgi:hypothetical protein
MSSAWSLTVTCLSAMTDRDQRFVIIWLQIAQIAEYALHFNCQLVFAEPRRTTYSGVAVGG